MNELNTELPAPQAGSCRACQLLNVPVERQITLKLERLRRHFPAAKFGDFDFRDFFVPKKIAGSRSRVKFAVGGSRAAPAIGFPRSDKTVADHPVCPLHHPRINALAEYLPAVIAGYKLDPYDPQTDRGELKGISIRLNHDSSEGILRFVLRSTEAITRLKKALGAIQHDFPEIKVISANIQPLRAAIFEGPEEQVLTAAGLISERYNGLIFAAGPQSFSQVTHETAEALFCTAAAEIGKSGGGSLLDLFCGTGVFSISAAKNLTTGCGVELSANAVECAELSAQWNQLANLKFTAADASAYLFGCKPGRFDRILCNPPRRGCGAEICSQILRLEPKTVIISSCGAEALAIDLERLIAKYRLTVLYPFEMFPLTDHCEVLTVLSAT